MPSHGHVILAGRPGCFPRAHIWSHKETVMFSVDSLAGRKGAAPRRQGCSSDDKAAAHCGGASDKPCEDPCCQDSSCHAAPPAWHAAEPGAASADLVPALLDHLECVRHTTSWLEVRSQ